MLRQKITGWTSTVVNTVTQRWNNSSEELRISLSGVPLQLEVCPFGPCFLLFTVFNVSHKPPHVHRPVHLPCILASQTQSSPELAQFTWITGISLTAAPRCRTKQSQPTSPRFAIDQQSETRQVFLGVAQYACRSPDK